MCFVDINFDYISSQVVISILQYPWHLQSAIVSHGPNFHFTCWHSSLVHSSHVLVCLVSIMVNRKATSNDYYFSSDKVFIPRKML